MSERAVEIFRKHHGLLRMSEALEAGINRYTLYTLKDRGVIEQVSRGLYRLAALPPIGNPDLVTVSLRYPKAVVCLISALASHEMTTQIPHLVSIALPRESRIPRLEYPPIRVHRFSYESYIAGIEKHKLDDVWVQIYNPEKTLADCFKFRNKIGMDVVLEALKLYKTRKKVKLSSLLNYARICRVEKIMRPYLEMMV
ncbi:MAG: transcriptional regulator [Candidatus Hydrogenedens sp.]|jgi:predicted transcriptional regulator of viral defense system|nr:transcriptional regulator [Candidatus Hydrogenedens sp.]